MQDVLIPYESDDGTLTEENPLRRVSQLCCDAAKVAGRPFNLAPQYKDFMERAGFADVVERRLKWPLNQWAKHPHYKEIGAWVQENLHTGIEGITMALFTRYLGWSKEEVLVAAMEYREALKNRTTHAYIPV